MNFCVSVFASSARVRKVRKSRYCCSWTWPQPTRDTTPLFSISAVRRSVWKVSPKKAIDLFACEDRFESVGGFHYGNFWSGAASSSPPAPSSITFYFFSSLVLCERLMKRILFLFFVLSSRRRRRSSLKSWPKVQHLLWWNTFWEQADVFKRNCSNWSGLSWLRDSLIGCGERERTQCGALV